MNTVLFACVHNAGRSQIARAFFERHADPAKAQAVSAGTQPAERMHPEVARVLAEAGLDVRDERPRLLTPELAASATLLVTMGCGETCPAVPGLRRIDWAIVDPKGRTRDEVQVIAREVESKVLELLDQEGWR